MLPRFKGGGRKPVAKCQHVPIGLGGSGPGAEKVLNERRASTKERSEPGSTSDASEPQRSPLGNGHGRGPAGELAQGWDETRGQLQGERATRGHDDLLVCLLVCKMGKERRPHWTEGECK